MIFYNYICSKIMEDSDVSKDMHSSANLKTESKVIDGALFGIVAILVIGISYLLYTNLRSATTGYQKGIASALGENFQDHSAALAYSRSLDFSMMKLSALFIGFILSLTGTLYLYKTFNETFHLDVDSKNFGKMTLLSSSPGLIITTLGIIVVLFALHAQSTIEYQPAALYSKTDTLMITRSVYIPHGDNATGTVHLTKTKSPSSTHQANSKSDVTNAMKVDTQFEYKSGLFAPGKQFGSPNGGGARSIVEYIPPHTWTNFDYHNFPQMVPSMKSANDSITRETWINIMKIYDSLKKRENNR